MHCVSVLVGMGAARSLTPSRRFPYSIGISKLRHERPLRSENAWGVPIALIIQLCTAIELTRMPSPGLRGGGELFVQQL